MKNWILILTLLITTISVFAQNNDCGYKTECICDTTNESVLYSMDNSDVVVHGKVVKIDTLEISEIITAESILSINQDSLKQSECAKKVLNTKKVIRTKITVDKSYKGLSQQQEIYIVTPLQENSCGYSEFRLGASYIIYGIKNRTADVYFLWTFDKDFFKLKQEYSIWTNTCKRTKLADKNEIMELNKIKQSLTKSKLH